MKQVLSFRMILLIMIKKSIPLLGYFKKLVNSQLEKFGQTIAQETVVPSFDRFSRCLYNFNLIPEVIFDVGVAYGTPWLYNAFPNAKYHLIDPTNESLPYMKKWSKKLDADIHQVALGEQEGMIEIKVRPEISGSSMFDEIGSVDIASTYSVPIVRFDSLFPVEQRRTLVKIDVQGAELSVLRGMGNRLKSIDFLIVETSLIATLKGSVPEFADVVCFLEKEGLVLYDFVGMTRRPLDRALAQVDAVFVQKSSPLRADRRWNQ
ncbi:FkbM family methyltransferase [Thermostichus vulcanus]|uniref:FkbM family methyltransferase n=1 Tax=Thermostichus vulcanus str. 'Rupite' TaxID=2813851 RepID=A0ABT0CDZ4_THEVL|nr:FkbM family methyltransferase [Thermostichus vulcanus str. 'Rupite']